MNSLLTKTGKFLWRYFVRPVADFFAVHFPNFYESVYNFAYRAVFIDNGEMFLVKMKDRTDCFRVKKNFDFSIALPLKFEYNIHEKKVAAVIHIFYPELAKKIKNLLYNIPCKVDVYISTVNETKKFEIEKIFADFGKGNVVVKIFENRGRDIAPAFVGFRDIYKNYDLCVHIHSKKSPHASGRLFGWRDYLYHNLLGSKEIVRGIFRIMDNENVGIVFPQYFTQIRLSINWGKNYELTKKYLSQLRIEIDNYNLIEFPAGSMFWFKPAALAPLINSDISFSDFPEEYGQTDGTFAHVIERSFLYIAESAGFSWIKVCSQKDAVSKCPVLESYSESELNENIKKSTHALLKNTFNKNFS